MNPIYHGFNLFTPTAVTGRKTQHTGRSVPDTAMCQRGAWEDGRGKMGVGRSCASQGDQLRKMMASGQSLTGHETAAVNT